MRPRLSERAEVGAIMALVLAVGLMAGTASGDVIPTAEKQERFERRDLNGDGVLNREEHHAASRTSRYDIDGDGEISDAELIAGREVQRARSFGRQAEARMAIRPRSRHAFGGAGRLKARRAFRGGYHVGR